jgi:hypothetical protein
VVSGLAGLLMFIGWDARTVFTPPVLDEWPGRLPYARVRQCRNAGRFAM